MIFFICGVNAAFTQKVKNGKKPLGWKNFLNVTMNIFKAVQSKEPQQQRGKKRKKKSLPTLPKLPFPNTLMKLNSSRPIRLVWACLTSPFSPFSPGLLSWLSVDVAAVALCSSPRLSKDNAFLMLFSSSLISVEMRETALILTKYQKSSLCISFGKGHSSSLNAMWSILR